MWIISLPSLSFIPTFTFIQNIKEKPKRINATKWKWIHRKFTFFFFLNSSYPSGFWKTEDDSVPAQSLFQIINLKTLGDSRDTHVTSSQLGHAPRRPPIIGRYEGNCGDFPRGGSSDKNGPLCGSDCPRETHTPREPSKGRGDEDRTERGRAVGLLSGGPGPAWYGLGCQRVVPGAKDNRSLSICVPVSAAEGRWAAGIRIIIGGFVWAGSTRSRPPCP